MSQTNHLTTKNLMAAFGVSHMTISAWRKGTTTREALPTVDTGPSRDVIFKEGPVKAWAKKHKVEILDKEALVRQTVPVPKPGPKVKAPAKVAALLKAPKKLAPIKHVSKLAPLLKDPVKPKLDKAARPSASSGKVAKKAK